MSWQPGERWCPEGTRPSMARDGIVLLYSGIRQPHLEHCAKFGLPKYQKNIKLLASAQRMGGL